MSERPNIDEAISEASRTSLAYHSALVALNDARHTQAAMRIDPAIKAFNQAWSDLVLAHSVLNDAIIRRYDGSPT